MSTVQGKADKDRADKEPVKAEKLKAKEVYTLIGTGKNKHMPKGVSFDVLGADAEIIINAGKATLK